VAIVPISTAGDRDRRSAFSELGGRGVFSKELEDALLEGRIDVAVHSAKDLTTDETPGLSLAAVLPRADPRDAWCGPHASLAAVPQGARVGTASMRRGAQLGALRPDLRVESMRGNVDTRLRKRSERGLDGVVLAACGLDRLELAHEIGFRIDVEEMLPETGQGFLALQARSEDAAALAVVGEAEAARILVAERSCAALLGGGCRAPVATHAVTQPDGRLWLRAWLALPDGSVVVVAEGRGLEPLALAGEVAGAALGRGGEAIVAAVRA
jgi:hydroxymethylbilane synthase